MVRIIINMIILSISTVVILIFLLSSLGYRNYIRLLTHDLVFIILMAVLIFIFSSII